MVAELPMQMAFFEGVVLALLGVGFWVGGVIVAHYLYEHYRGGE